MAQNICQTVVRFSLDDFKQFQTKCNEEKRSMAGQVEYLLAQIPYHNEQYLLGFQSKHPKYDREKQRLKRFNIKLSKELYFSNQWNSAVLEMEIHKFIGYILELWIYDELLL